MNILYLHGLMSNSQTPKVDWLRELGHTVSSPDLNYKEEGATLFNDLGQWIVKNNVELIIGSSMGGFLGFHLGNSFNIPTLLFNPSLAPNEIAKPDVVHVSNNRVLHSIILGQHDDVVIPADTIHFLKDKNANFKYVFEDSGHRTSLNLFKIHFQKCVQPNRKDLR